MTPLDPLLILNQLHLGIPTIASRLANDSSFGDASNFDLLTNDPGIEVWSSDFLDELEMSINGQRFTDLDAYIVDDALRLSAGQIDALLGSELPDGVHQVQLEVPGKVSAVSFQITLDRTAPVVTLESGGNSFKLKQRQLGPCGE
ncbi:MAG: hypothetical protein R3C05_11050 [Pirellulaceae bacterium]